MVFSWKRLSVGLQIWLYFDLALKKPQLCVTNMMLILFKKCDGTIFLSVFYHNNEEYVIISKIITLG